MKNMIVLILALLLVVLLSTISYGEVTVLETETLDNPDLKINPTIQVICIDGQKFVMASKGESLSIIQVYENNVGKVLPTKCGGNN